jgi:AAA family ATP:ADP antiporter
MLARPAMGGISLRPAAGARPTMKIARPCAVRPAAVLPTLKTPSLKPTAVPQSRPFLGTKPVAVPAPSVATAATSGDAAPAPKKILGYEPMTWAKILPLGLMFFCILFNYTILRDTKDVLVVTAPGSGAEIIPFLKTWVNLPMAIGFTILYAKLANVLSSEALFYSCIIPFILFFGAFAGLLYPLRDVLHPTEFCEKLLEQAGPRFAGPIAIVRNWTYCLFYVMAELWGSVVVSVLFWGFANQITTVDEASQFYPLFGLGANVALIFSGQAVKYFSLLRADLPPGVDGWGMSLNGLMGMVVIGGLIITATYWALQRFVVPKIPKREAKKKKKEKMSVGESFAFLAKSSYIRDMAMLVVAYGISINLVEVTWKSKIKAQFPNPNDYSYFMGQFSTATGAATFTMMILSRFIFKKFGWGVAALITPTVLLATGLVFFALVLFSDTLSPTLAALGMTPLYAAVLVGAAQNVFSKSSKYSLFDPCKEMAYIPLDDEVKTKGKAAIDVICNPLGKSGGALIQQFMIIGFGSLAASTPYLGVILFSIVILWIGAANSLNKQFIEIQKEGSEESSNGASDVKAQ